MSDTNKPAATAIQWAISTFNHTPTDKLPECLQSFARAVSARIGWCSEVAITTLAQYANIVLHLPVGDPMYAPDDFAKQWFGVSKLATPTPASEPPAPQPHEAAADTKPSEPQAANIVSDDQDIAKRVQVILNQRDDYRQLAAQMIATILEPRNADEPMHKLVTLAREVFEPEFKRATAGTQLTDEQVDLALAADGIDVKNAHERMMKIIREHEQKGKR